MRHLGVITIDLNTPLTFERWEEVVLRSRRCVRGRPGQEGGHRWSEDWSVVESGVRVGALDWYRDDKAAGRPGYVVVRAEVAHAESVSQLAESLAAEVGATFRRCSKRFNDVEDFAEQSGERLVEIELTNGRKDLAEIAYCLLTRDKERIYYFAFDSGTLGGREGLCGVSLENVRSMRTSDLRKPQDG
jgi:hypothetical protein